MSIRTFIFCDACNSQGVRTENVDFLYSRRSCDVRSWFEGEETNALKLGWTTTSEGFDICPKCQRNGLAETAINKKTNPIRQFARLVGKVQLI